MFRRFFPSLSHRVARRLAGFAGSNRGSVSVELVLTLPLLLWALAATVVFFDGYKARYQTQMAAQTVADIMSRSTDLFTGPYIEGLNGVFDFLAESRYPTRIRVSSVIWDSANQRNRLQWSYGTRGLTGLPEDTFELLQNDDLETLRARFGDDPSYSFTGAAAQMPVTDLANRIPPVLPGEALLVVETFALWEPFANVGVGRLRFTPVVVVRPRFAPWINFQGVEPIYPEADYELAWTGGGNDSLPDPNQPAPDPTPAPNDPSRSFSFDNGVTTGWSRTTITAGGPTGGYLGPFGTETWASPVTLSLDTLGANRNATITFDLLVIDSWDGLTGSWHLPRGDIFQILFDGTPISWDPFVAATAAPYDRDRVQGGYLGAMTYTVAMTRTRMGTNFTGNSGFIDQIWRVTLNLYNAPQTFTLGFSTGVDEALDNESFGIDNFAFTVAGSGTAAPFTPNAANLLTADPHTRYPRYRGCPEYRIAAPWLTMRRSDLPSGLSMQRTVGGTQQLNRCSGFSGTTGYVTASPHLILNYDNENVSSTTSGILLRMEDGNSGRTCDSTLLLRDPNGQWYFNDDFSGAGYNAGLQITNPPSGQYAIFIGTYSSGSCNSTLTVSRYTR